MQSVAQHRGRFKPQPTPAARAASGGGVPVYVGDRVVGHVRGDTFHKSIRPNHYLTRPRAIALDVGNVRDAIAAGATHAQIVDAESGATYRAALDDILRDGTRFNRGYGDQIFLPLDQWTRPDRGDQLALFDLGVTR